MIRIIPNIFTLTNLFFGCVSIIFLFSENFYFSLMTTIFSIIFDFMDGYVSKKMKIQNQFGKELDSLADMVSFGIVPSIIVFILLKKTYLFKIRWIAFFISIFSAWRLANFNIKKNNNQTYGLNTPINTLFFSIFSIISTDNKIVNFDFIKKIIHSPITIIFMIIFSCYHLNSKRLMLSFDFIGFSWNKNKERYIFLLISLFLLLTLHIISLPCIIIIYVIISIYYKN